MKRLLQLQQTLLRINIRNGFRQKACNATPTCKIGIDGQGSSSRFIQARQTKTQDTTLDNTGDPSIGTLVQA
jgi:hypothetical protein